MATFRKSWKKTQYLMNTQYLVMYCRYMAGSKDHRHLLKHPVITRWITLIIGRFQFHWFAKWLVCHYFLKGQWSCTSMLLLGPYKFVLLFVVVCPPVCVINDLGGFPFIAIYKYTLYFFMYSFLYLKWRRISLHYNSNLAFYTLLGRTLDYWYYLQGQTDEYM